MRSNLPVSGKEIELGNDALIVSKTDLKGLITYVNKDFLGISGFSEAELIGQPHNIVRHPDMPVEAFADLWNTLKAGRPWTGLVKNRCKNGDHYWVLANVAPIVEDGRHVGYISVRRKPGRDAVQAHEAVYRRFREGSQGKLAIRYGQAVRPFPFSFADLGIGAKLWGAIGVVVAIGAIAIGSSWFGMQEAQRRFTGFVDHEQRLLDSYSEMYAQGLQMGQALRNIVLDPANRKAYENLEQARRDFRQQLESAREVKEADKTVGDGLERIAELSGKHFAIHDRIVAAVKANDLAAAHGMLNSDDTPLWREYKKILLDSRKALSEQAARGREGVAGMVNTTGRISLFFGAIALIVATLTALLLTRTIRRPMEEMDDTFANVLQGNYSNVIDISRNDEIGKAMQGLQVLQTRMGFELSETKRLATENLRIVTSLDKASVGVTVSDDGNALIYMNEAAGCLWASMESGIRARMPGFDASAMLGKPLAASFEDRVVQAAYSERMTGPREFEMPLAGRDLHLAVTPIYGADGHYVGQVTEWRDRTAEVAIEREIGQLVDAAAAGDFTRRLSLEGKKDFFAGLAEGLNKLLDTASEGLRAVAAVLGGLARGDLTQNMTGEYQGTFGEVQADTNATVARLREVVANIKEAADAINTAAQEISAGNHDLSNRTEEQASSLEETASSMEELNATVRQNAENARQANDLAKTSNESAERGGAVVRQVVATMNEIQDSSRKIADIVGVIDSIAFQTNILALNAAVEAARAGEQGRGFAVVATEVRNLAQRSATAAKEIKALIGESVGKIEHGAELAGAAGSAMDDVVSSFARVAGLITEISSASREQAGGIEQVTQAVGQMDEVTQQNAALVEQAAAAAESLEEQAGALVQSVGIFKLGGGSDDRSPPVVQVQRQPTGRRRSLPLRT